MPFDHVCLTVPRSKLDALVAFLTSALGHTGFRVIANYEDGAVVGMGEKSAYFWLYKASRDDVEEAAHLAVLKQTHVAFRAEGRRGT